MKLVFAELMIWFAYLVITKFIDASRQNDFIVRHGTGDYGAVKKDIFAQTYDMSGAYG